MTADPLPDPPATPPPSGRALDAVMDAVMDGAPGASGDGPAPAIRTCRFCPRVLSPTAIYCPDCGKAQFPIHASRQQHSRVRANESSTHPEWPLIRQVLVLYVIILAGILPLYWLPAPLLVPGTIAVCVIVGVVILVACRQVPFPLRTLLLPNRPALRWCALAPLLVGALIPVNVAYHHLLQALLHLPIPSLSDPFLRSGSGWTIAILVICVWPAIFEELAFRGVIQTALIRVIGPAQAIVLSALLFATIHRVLFSAPYLFLVGFVLAWVRQRSNSLLPGMIIHGLHNGVVLWATCVLHWV